MLVRFAVLERDSDSQVERGLFQATESLRSAGRLAEYEEAIVRETFRWFNRCLPVPGRFSRSSRAHAAARAISWFKPTARECIARMRELAAVLEEHGHHTLQLTTGRPGYVVYEDAYQVVAEPFPAEYEART
jgi:hypothetical protein